MQWLIPFQTHFEVRIWSNMTKPFLLPHQMAHSLLALGSRYTLGLMSLPACDKRLRRILLLFSMLFGVTFLFGQFHERRQFNAFISGIDRCPVEHLAANARPGTGRCSPIIAGRLSSCGRSQVHADGGQCVICIFSRLLRFCIRFARCDVD
jgi:hypothetical protein